MGKSVWDREPNDEDMGDVYQKYAESIIDSDEFVDWYDNYLGDHVQNALAMWKHIGIIDPGMSVREFLKLVIAAKDRKEDDQGGNLHPR